MNIGFDFRMGGVGHAGLGRYASELLHHLLELKTNDKFVVFFNDSAEISELKRFARYENVELVRVRARHYSVLEQTEFLRVLNKYQLDLVHFPNFNHPIRYKGKFVVTIHDLVHHELSGHKPTHFFHFWAYKRVMRHAVSNSSAILTPSNASKDSLVKQYAQAVGADKSKISEKELETKIYVTYEAGVLAEPGPEYVDKIKKQYLLSRPYFLFVGTFERKKMVPNLARAFDLFIEKYKMDMDLVLAGKVDRHYPEEREKILQIKNSNRIVLTGFVSDKELAALYSGAYAYISLSPNEGFGLPGVEALGFGLPIITVNVPVANEIYDSAALYCEVGNAEDAADKMHLLARDAQFYKRQSDVSLKRSRMFGWEKCASETLEVYKQVMSDNEISNFSTSTRASADKQLPISN